MIILKVPYAEKDEAKALGARWNKERKLWYVAEGQDASVFKRWHTPQPAPGAVPAAPLKSAKVDTFAAKVSIGARYIALEHACDPLTECAQCQPQLAQSGWSAGQQAIGAALKAMGGNSA
jgi:hypothetical protein